MTNRAAGINESGAEQLGLITRAQLYEVGLTRAAIARRLASGELKRLFPSVYALQGAPPSTERELLAACLSLGEGAAASHRTAAWLWGLDGFRVPPTVHELTISAGGTNALAGFRVHQPRLGLPEGYVIKRGVPTTVLTRTMLDLASLLREAPLEVALDSAARGNPEFFLELDEFLCGLDPRGRDGIGTLKDLIALRRRGEATGSEFETQLFQVLRRTRLPMPVLQYPVFEVPDHPFTLVDFAWVRERIALYPDGASIHVARRRARFDALQRLKLTTLGWRPVVVMPKMLDDPAWVRTFARMFEAPVIPG